MRDLSKSGELVLDLSAASLRRSLLTSGLGILEGAQATIGGVLGTAFAST